MSNPFDALGLTSDEVDSAMADARNTASRRDGRVCLCGHPAKTHSSEGEGEVQKALHAAGRDQCRYGRMKCPCNAFVPVLVSDNVRSFTYKTTGIGTDHALLKGMAAAVSGGADVEWIKEPHCAFDDCENTGRMTIVAVNQYSKRSKFPEAVNRFFCDEHLALL